MFQFPVHESLYSTQTGFTAGVLFFNIEHMPCRSSGPSPSSGRLGRYIRMLPQDVSSTEAGHKGLGHHGLHSPAAAPPGAGRLGISQLWWQGHVPLPREKP